MKEKTYFIIGKGINYYFSHRVVASVRLFKLLASSVCVCVDINGSEIENAASHSINFSRLRGNNNNLRPSICFVHFFNQQHPRKGFIPFSYLANFFERFCFNLKNLLMKQVECK
jgi:hypothetical protein